MRLEGIGCPPLYVYKQPGHCDGHRDDHHVLYLFDFLWVTLYVCKDIPNAIS